jgi:fatty acid desaturase
MYFLCGAVLSFFMTIKLGIFAGIISIIFMLMIFCLITALLAAICEMIHNVMQEDIANQTQKIDDCLCKLTLLLNPNHPPSA